MFVACTNFKIHTPIQIESVAGKSVTVDISQAGWPQDTHFIISPGGYYSEQQIMLSQPPRLITAREDHVYIAMQGGGIALFTQTTLNNQSNYKLAHSATLSGEITHLALSVDSLVAITSARQIYLRSPTDLGGLAEIHFPKHVNTITDIAIDNQSLFAVFDESTLIKYDLNKPNESQPPIELPFRARKLLMNGDIGYAAVQPNKLLSFSLDKQRHVTILDTVNLPARVEDMQFHDDHLYIATGSSGVTVLHANGTGQLRWRGSHNKLGTMQRLKVKPGTLLADNDQRGIATLDIRKPTLPITRDLINTDTEIVGFDISGNKLVIAQKDKLNIVNIDHTNQQQISAEGINLGGSRRAAIHNNIAYVADWFSGLHLYDISLPHFPRHLGNYHTPGSSKGVVIKDHYAIVADDDHGLQIIDVSNPRAPVKVSEVQTTGLAYTMKLVENRIYLADHRGGFHIVDISDINQPLIIGGFDTPSKSWAIDVEGNTAFVADDSAGLLIFDVGDASAPLLIGQFNPDGQAEDVVVRDNFAYVSFFDKGLYIVDISNPRQPSAVSHTPIPGNARSVHIHDNFAYIAAWEAGLIIVDISDVNSPVVLSQLDTNGAAWGADIHQQHAYIWDWWGGVKVADVSNPNQPRIIGKYQSRGVVHQMRVRGNYLYTAKGEGGLQVFDISNPLNPIWVTGLDNPGSTLDIWLDKTRGYIATDTSTISVVDIGDPFYVRPQTQITIDFNAQRACAQSNLLLAANINSGFALYDISHPDYPALIARWNFPARDIWADSVGFYIVTQGGGLLFLEFDHETGKLYTHTVSKQQFDWVRARGADVIAATRTGQVTYFRKTDDGFTTLNQQHLGIDVTSVEWKDNVIYIAGDYDGLREYEINSNGGLIQRSYYPAHAPLKSLAIKEHFALFGGDPLIMSTQLIPWVTMDEHLINIPADLPPGKYHLTVDWNDGRQIFLPNYVGVSLPSPGKPKLTLDRFKQLLNDHREQ